MSQAEVERWIPQGSPPFSLTLPAQVIITAGTGSDSKIGLVFFENDLLFPSSSPRRPVGSVLAIQVGDSSSARTVRTTDDLDGQINIASDYTGYGNAQRLRFNQVIH